MKVSNVKYIDVIVSEGSVDFQCSGARSVYRTILKVGAIVTLLIHLFMLIKHVLPN